MGSRSKQQNILERFLGLFAEVRRGEGTTVFLLMLNLFILLTAYLVIKPVREALILTGGGAEMKSYAAGGQALLLLLVVPLYGSLASKVNRIKLINRVTLFFILNLALFYLLAQFHAALGLVFFLWVGIFNLLLIAQFWSFANDLYTPEQGERLFAIVAFGGSMGAILGPMVAEWLFRPLGAYQLMLVAAALLGISLPITNIINAREKRLGHGDAKSTDAEKLLRKEGGFGLVLQHRYLLLIALLMVVANLVNTTGEFILGKKVAEEARQIVAKEVRHVALVDVAAGLTTAQREKLAQDFVGTFYANFLFWVSLCQLVIQLFFVSRIFKYVGVAGALFFLPLVALAGYSLMAFIPVLSYIRTAKILENSTDYSLQNTTRQALFLPTNREVKYKAKAAIDTFFVRMGDVLSAGIVFLGTYIVLNTEAFATINVGLIIVWLAVVIMLGRHYRKLALPQVEAPT